MIVGSAIIMQQIDSTVITTALPQMAISLHTDPVRLSVAITAYLLSLAVFVPVSGWAAERFGGRTVFRAAIALFTLGSMLCGLANNVVELTAARVLQGFGGAMMVPVGRLVLFRSIDKAALIGIMAYLQVPAQLGPVLGPPIGGFITTYFSWRWIFLVNVPLGILGIVLVTLFFDNPKEDTPRPFDWAGFLLTGAALSCIMYGVEALGRGRGEVPVAVGLLVCRLRRRCAGATASAPHQTSGARPFGVSRRYLSRRYLRRLAVPRRRRNAGVSAAASASGRVRPVGGGIRQHYVCDRGRFDVDEDRGTARSSPASASAMSSSSTASSAPRPSPCAPSLCRATPLAADLPAAAGRRVFPVAAIHRDPGDGLRRCRASRR